LLRYFCFLKILECLHSKEFAENKNGKRSGASFLFFCKDARGSGGIYNPFLIF
jgi:hypothetical protein